MHAYIIEAMEQLIGNVATTCKDNGNFEALNSIISDIFSSPESLSSYFCINGNEAEPVDIIYVRKIYQIFSDNGESSVEEQLFMATKGLLEKLNVKVEDQSLIASLIVIYENPQLQSPEYFDDVMPNLCRIVQKLTVPSQAILVRFWAKFDEFQLRQLVISLQQYLTCAVVNVVAQSESELMKSLEPPLPQILYNLDMIYLANCLGGIKRETNAGYSGRPTNADDSSSANNAHPQVGVFVRTVGGLRRKQDVRRHELQQCLDVDPATCRDPIISFNSFYNEALSDAVDPRYDYSKFTISGVSLLNFPCAIMPFNKTQYLSLDCRLRQNDQLGASIFLSLINRGIPNPFLFIRVRRDHLIEDALWQVQ